METLLSKRSGNIKDRHVFVNNSLHLHLFVSDCWLINVNFKLAHRNFDIFYS